MSPLRRRHLLIASLALPAGCSLQRLPEMTGEAVGTPSPLPVMRAPQVGQQWTYQQLNVFNAARVGSLTERLSSSDDGWTLVRHNEHGQPLSPERHVRWGEVLTDPGWDVPLLLEQALPLWPQTLTPQPWSVHTHYREPGGSYRYWLHMDARLMGWERIQVPAGRFLTARVERRLRLEHPDPTRVDTLRRETLWLAPEVGRWVARENQGQYTIPSGDSLLGDVQLEDHFRWELTAWSAP